MSRGLSSFPDTSAFSCRIVRHFPVFPADSPRNPHGMDLDFNPLKISRRALWLKNAVLNAVCPKQSGLKKKALQKERSFIAARDARKKPDAFAPKIKIGPKIIQVLKASGNPHEPMFKRPVKTAPIKPPGMPALLYSERGGNVFSALEIDVPTKEFLWPNHRNVSEIKIRRRKSRSRLCRRNARKKEKRKTLLQKAFFRTSKTVLTRPGSPRRCGTGRPLDPPSPVLKNHLVVQ